jgi:hypothetical protein
MLLCGTDRCCGLQLRENRSLLLRHLRLLGWGRTPCACASIPAATTTSRNCQLLQVNSYRISPYFSALSTA